MFEPVDFSIDSDLPNGTDSRPSVWYRCKNSLPMHTYRTGKRRLILTRGSGAFTFGTHTPIAPNFFLSRNKLASSSNHSEWQPSDSLVPVECTVLLAAVPIHRSLTQCICDTTIEQSVQSMDHHQLSHRFNLRHIAQAQFSGVYVSWQKYSRFHCQCVQVTERLQMITIIVAVCRKFGK